MVTPTNKPRSNEDDVEEDVGPLADSDVPADVLAEFDGDLEAALADWGDALEASQRRRAPNTEQGDET